MSKKPRKVEEPSVPYTAKKPVKTGAVTPKVAGETEFKRIADKLFSERKDLLHKLAQ